MSTEYLIFQKTSFNTEWNITLPVQFLYLYTHRHTRARARACTHTYIHPQLYIYVNFLGIYISNTRVNEDVCVYVFYTQVYAPVCR